MCEWSGMLLNIFYVKHFCIKNAVTYWIIAFDPPVPNQFSWLSYVLAVSLSKLILKHILRWQMPSTSFTLYFCIHVLQNSLQRHLTKCCNVNHCLCSWAWNGVYPSGQIYKFSFHVLQAHKKSDMTIITLLPLNVHCKKTA